MSIQALFASVVPGTVWGGERKEDTYVVGGSKSPLN
jgi:hypothetical protein